MKRPLSLAPLFVAIVFPFVSVQACGPFFEPDIFVHNLHPDHPADYAAGKLGILLPTYPRADLIFAWRYLNGAPPTREELEAYQPTYGFGETVPETDSDNNAVRMKAPDGSPYAEPPGPADVWLKARNNYAPAPPEVHTVKNYGVTYTAGMILAGSYDNCQGDAFRTAALTVDSRAKTWGAKSPEVADWIRAQDAVFSNCGGSGNSDYPPPGTPKITPTQPAPASGNAPALLRQDRAYQIAAAQFYASQFVPARASFQAIAADPDSPWRGIAAYVVARTLIRDAFLSAPPNSDNGGGMAAFDPALMRQAQQQLERIRDEHPPGISAHAIQSLLNLVRLRTEPKARLREISAALSKPDANFKQDLDDLTWYLDMKADSLPVREDTGDEAFDVQRGSGGYQPLTPAEKQPGFEQALKDLSDLRSISPLIDWLITFQSPAESAHRHALEEWKRTSSTAWLAAAIMKAKGSDAATPDLLEAAARVPASSPAWPTIAYHRLRLLTDTGHAAQARAEITAALPSIQALASDSDLNLFTGLRMRTATTLEDALTDAPRRILDRTSQQQSSLDECLDIMKDPKRKYDCRDDKSPVEFSSDAANLLNDEMPLATLARAAQSGALPPRLRQSVAMTAWVRAVLLKDESTAAQMLPLLPEKLKGEAGAGVGWHPLMALLRNPGLRPYLDSGVQRSYSYDFVESYSDNWWCEDWSSPYGGGSGEPAGSTAAVFLTADERAAAAKQLAELRALGSADEVLGAQAVAYVKDHPQDPDAPEALYLVLRMMRYSCSRDNGTAEEKARGDRVASIANEAGALMRHRYPTNAWTKKAAPYVWVKDKKTSQ